MTTESSVGSFLKQKREGQGLSLDQVASLTRIQSKFLHALEEETFADLPEQVFTRGFVRTYARSLGINEEDALRRFSEASSAFYERGVQEQQQVSLKIQEERQGKLNRNLVIGITVVILIALGLFLPRQQQTPTPSTSQDTASSPPASSLPLEEEDTQKDQEKTAPGEIAPEDKVVSEVPIAVPSAPETVAQPTDVEKKTPNPAASTDDPMILELEAKQLTWVVVKSDDEAPHEALLQPGQRATWKGNSQFTLTLGNAAGVAIRLNGESRGPFGKPGQVVREVVIRK